MNFWMSTLSETDKGLLNYNRADGETTNTIDEVEPSDFIEYQLNLPTIPDNLIFNKVSDIQNNCEVVYDNYMYKTYKAPQEIA